jgi:hypothetical protein
MDDTRVDDVHVKLRIVASLRQNHYASDWNGIAVHEKGLWTSVRRTVLGWWENKIAAMSHLQQLCEDANNILSRAIADHIAHKKEPNFEKRVKDPRSRVHKNANFIKNWATDMSEAIGTREQGMATQYVVYAGDIPTISKLDGIIAKMCNGVECARTFFPADVPVPKTHRRCAVGGAVFDDEEDEETTSQTPPAAALQQYYDGNNNGGASSFPYNYDHHQQHFYEAGQASYFAPQPSSSSSFAAAAAAAPMDIGGAPHASEGAGLMMVHETPFGTPDDVNSVANSVTSQKQHDAL